MSSRTRIRVLLLLVASAAAFTPLRLPVGGAAPEAGAVCTTCCPQGGTKCVVCSLKCLVIDDAYDIGGGKCPIATN
jgi:hypothetical protein